jgi:hypothetical protein
MAKIKLDTSNPNKAADVLARASILFARVSGYNAENKIRAQLGKAKVYGGSAFEGAITECFPETPRQRRHDKLTTAETLLERIDELTVEVERLRQILKSYQDERVELNSIVNNMWGGTLLEKVRSAVATKERAV